MDKKFYVFLVVVLVMTFGLSLNVSAEDLSQEELLKRTADLEGKVSKLNGIINNLQAKQDAVAIKVDSLSGSSKACKGEAVTSKQKVEIYGFVKLDASLDDSKTNDPDAPRYASSEGNTSNEGQYTMTAMNTRLGLKFFGPETDEADVFGNIELDFLDTASDNAQKPRMRHAFFEVKFPKWDLLAGQTWDVFGPLGSSTLNTGAWLWDGGNIGVRRPQVRLTNKFDINTDKKITTQLSLNRNIGMTNGTVNTGENSSQPMVQGRVAYDFTTCCGKKTTLGVAGLYGLEKINRNDGVDETNYTVPAWGVGLDLAMALNSKLSLKGEFFQGSNLNALLAGLGYGINTTLAEGVDTMGGWTQLTYKVSDKGEVNLIYGTERLAKKDLNAGNRSSNQMIVVNYMHTIVTDVKVGVEYANMFTEYVGADRGSNNRLTTSFIYSF
ncbi:MAG: hypothetical protein ABII88_08615 [Candidatus Omnitrophota bacterium]